VLILDTVLCICATAVLFPDPQLTAGVSKYILLFDIARGTTAGSSVAGGDVAGDDTVKRGEKDSSNISMEFSSVSENKTNNYFKSGLVSNTLLVTSLTLKLHFFSYDKTTTLYFILTF